MTLIGNVENLGQQGRLEWIERLDQLGRKAT
jgi:hypothetical protein